MKTVTSVSGGKTSCMMSLKFPTDYYVFAVVLTKHVNSKPKDKGLLRECQKKIPHFIASLEADLTLSNVLKLEQELGKEIKWVSSEFYLDDFIDQHTDYPGFRSKKYLLPSFKNRFCTQYQKVVPIFWHCYLNYYVEDPILMNIGFRYDESRRVNNWTCEHEKTKFFKSCDINSKRYKWETLEWRISNFPLYDAKITNDEVVSFWDKKGWVFPENSNCRFCFFKTQKQLLQNAQLEKENLEWWLEMERISGQTFNPKNALKNILEKDMSNNVVENNNFTNCHCTD